MNKKPTKRSLQAKLRHCKKKLEELEYETFSMNCSECEEMEYLIYEFQSKIDDLEKEIEKFST